MARPPLHERSLLAQWADFLFSPKNFIVKLSVAVVIVFLFLPGPTKAQVVETGVMYLVYAGMVYLGFKMILGVFMPKKKKGKNDH